MDYEKHYNRLISNARVLTENRNNGGYYETHHIIPKSLGGDNSPQNLVMLTAKEHFVAHHLLWRIHRSTEHRFKMAKAFLSMTKNGKGQERYYSARGYEEAHKAHSVVMKEWIVDNHPKGFQNKEHTASTKRQISESVKRTFAEIGLLKPVFRFSKQGKLLQGYNSITDAAKDVGGVPSNIKYTCEGKFKTAYGFRWSYNQNRCDMRSLKRKSHYHTDEKKQAMSKQFKGTVPVRDNDGSVYRVDVNDPRYVSGQLKHAAVGSKKPTRTCEHCQKTISITNYKRWHGPTCKHRKQKA
jgi:hypothetical protein